MSAGRPPALRWNHGSKVKFQSRKVSSRNVNVTGLKKTQSNGTGNATRPSKQTANVNVIVKLAKSDGTNNVPDDAVKYPVQNTQDQVDFSSGMEAASKSLQQLGILEPSELAVSLPPSGSAKSGPKKKVANPDSLTPTVILNGLAMARGEQVSYKVVKKTPLPCQPIYKTDFYENTHPCWAGMYFYHNGFENGYQDRYFRGQRQNPVRPVKHWIYPFIFQIEVTVGDRSFIGEGKSQQIARHNAAQKALEVLQTMPIVSKNALGDKKNKSGTGDEVSKGIAKSPISLLYEKAAEHKLKVRFELTNEEGPPHMRYFTMNAAVFKPSSGVVATGEGKGTSKNAARTKAAVAASEKLDKMPLTVTNLTSKKTSKTTHSKIASVLSSTIVLHPCSRLNQILQVKHENLPTYAIIPIELPCETEFVIQCSAMGQSAVGRGKSKKEARRNAADNLLKDLGFHPQLTQPTISGTAESTAKKVQGKHRSKSVTRDVLPPLMEVNFEMQV